MSLTITADLVSRCEQASRVMLSPLSYPDVAEWQREVNRALSSVFDVDHTLFALPREGGIVYFSEDMDSAMVDRFHAYVHEAVPGTVRSTDPSLDTWFSRRRSLGIHVYGHRTMDEVTEGAYSRSTFFHEVTIPGKMYDHVGISADMPEGEAFICLARNKRGAGRSEDEALLLLRTLLPAFQAGVSAINRLDAQREAMVRTLDQLEDALYITDLDGNRVHANVAFGLLVEAESEASRLLNEVQYAAACLRPGKEESSTRIPFPAQSARRFNTRTKSYSLDAHYLPEGMLVASGAVVVRVECVGSTTSPSLPVPALIADRFGLTAREAEVTYWLGMGLTNVEIGNRLFVSPHTVRHHTERIFKKLGISTRKALALKLIDRAPIQA